MMSVLTTSILNSQNIAITDDGSYSADNSAMLDVKSTSKGMLIPRVTWNQRENISAPATGLFVFQTDSTEGFYYNQGTSANPDWIRLSTESCDLWERSGHFTILSNGPDRVGIGVDNPCEKMEVSGTGNVIRLTNNVQNSLMVGFNTTSSTLFVGGSNHRVGIGTSSPDYKLQVDGTIAPEMDNSYDLGSSSRRWDDVYATNGIIQTSDKRLKTNIEAMGYGLNEVLHLKPVNYTWKSKPEKGEQLGLIAQDVMEIIPEIVNVGDDERQTLGLHYDKLVPILIKAIQEQQVMIEELRTKIDKMN
ncbi:MAG: tail fiber domain-containing protein [Bacteroidales bacterium]|nr:tail fiber domain-containing protein [Bacteroidales bacterium]